MKILFLVIIACYSIIDPTSLVQHSDEAKEIDEFGNICCGEEKARLDIFATQLLNEPEAQGYIIFYEGKRYRSCYDRRRRIPRLGEAEARVARAKAYLIYDRNFKPNRIVIVNGGFREEWMTELWVVPKGAKPPVPTPTLEAKDVKFRKGKVTKGEFQDDCIE